MEHDTWLIIMIALGVFFFTSLFWILYGIRRADQMRQIHAREVEGLKMEISTVNRIRIDE